MQPTYNVEQFRETFEHEFTWLNGFLRNVGRFGDRPALFDPETGRRWTYSDLNADANRLAHAFLKRGAGCGSVVMYMLFNSPEFALCYLACHKTGSISCPVNYRLSAGEIRLQLEDSRPRIFVYDSEFEETAVAALKMSHFQPDSVIAASGLKSGGRSDFAAIMADEPTNNPTPPRRQHIYDETCRLYTSGTTNRAKAVPINCINEVLSAHDVMMHFPLTPNDRTMNMTPWFHRGGLHSGGITPTFYAGGEVLALREFHPRECLKLAEREKATFLIGVPSILALLARAQSRQPVDLSALRGIITMGSPLDKAACERYMELLTPNIFNGYGTTETFWNTFLRPYTLPEMAGSAGQSCTDDDVRVARLKSDGSLPDPENTVTKDMSEVGEVLIRSPAKSAGCYVNNDSMTAAKFHNGFHYTGDLGVWDKNEFVTIVGRKDDMVLNAGENVYPAQIEAILNEHPKVAESAVIGVPDRLHGQALAAYVVAADPTLDIQELKNFCIGHPMLPAFKRPRYFNLVAELPHTATGKLMRYKLREAAKPEYEE